MKALTQEEEDLIAECNRTIKDADAPGAGYRTVARGKIARIAMAALTAEPVGYVSNVSRKLADEGRLGYISNHIVAGLEGGYVYDAPPLPAAPEGWKLVPVEPTREMRMQIHPISVGRCTECDREVTADCEENVLLSWADMLAAAPTPL